MKYCFEKLVLQEDLSRHRHQAVPAHAEGVPYEAEEPHLVAGRPEEVAQVPELAGATAT